MVVGEIAEAVDLLVVGGGPGGYVAAVRAAELGREVLLVDRGGPEGGLGGACLHVGCIPSKALIELAATVEHVSALQGEGLTGPLPEIDLAAHLVRKRGIVDGLAGGVAGLLAKHGVRHVVGELRFNKPDRAAVILPNGSNLFVEFAQAIVATGSRPVDLPGLPADGDRVLSSSGALDLAEVPATLAVVGAGYVGLELGMAYARLGARVTVVEALDRILPTVDESLTRPVRRALQRLGIDLRLETRALRVDGDDLVVAQGGEEHRVAAERVVVAVGRTPNTDDVGLGRAQIPVGADGRIPVDERCLATPRVAAIGDVVAGPALAHKASAEGIVAAEALCGLPSAFDATVIPQVIFTTPEVASVGLSEADARAAGYDVTVGTAPLGASGRAATLGARDGFTRVVVDRGADRVLGVHIVGPHASELIAEGSLAIEMQASADDLGGTIHPHPTLSEGLHDAIAHAARGAARERGVPTG